MNTKDELKNRLTQALHIRDMKAIDLCNKTGIPKSAISYYMSGKSKPKSDRVFLISEALNVDEAWLMGYPVSMERKEKQSNDSNGTVLKELIEKSNLTDVEIAKELHISLDDLKAYESGMKDIPLEILLKFSSFFGVSIDELQGVNMFKEGSTAFVSTNERPVELHKRWAEKVGKTDFTDKEHDLIVETALFIKSIRGREDNDKLLDTAMFMIEQLGK